MRVVPLPPATELEELLARLLSRDVKARGADGQPAPAGPAALGLYRTEAPVLEVVARCDLRLAAALAAALTLVPPDAAAAQASAGALDESLRENLAEVMNVLARYVSGSGRRFVLAAARCPPEAADPALLAAADASDEVRAFAVTVPGYQGGNLTFHTL